MNLRFALAGLLLAGGGSGAAAFSPHKPFGVSRPGAVVATSVEKGAGAGPEAGAAPPTLWRAPTAAAMAAGGAERGMREEYYEGECAPCGCVSFDAPRSSRCTVRRNPPDLLIPLFLHS